MIILVKFTKVNHSKNLRYFFRQNLRMRASITNAIFIHRTSNILKPTGYVTHQQFNIQQLYALPTLYLCALYLSENKQRLVPLTS